MLFIIIDYPTHLLYIYFKNYKCVREVKNVKLHSNILQVHNN